MSTNTVRLMQNDSVFKLKLKRFCSFDFSRSLIKCDKVFAIVVVEDAVLSAMLC